MSITYPDSGFFYDDTVSTNTATKSATLTAGATKLIVSVIGRATISGVTYNGVSMTLIAASTLQYGYNYHSDYYLDSPATGSAHNIVATYSGNNQFRGIAYASVAGCATGIGAVPALATGKADGSQISTSITTTSANSDIVESSYCNNIAATLTLGSGQSLVIGIPGSGTWTSIDKRSVTTATSYSVTIQPSGTPNQDVIVYEVKIAAPAVNGNFLSIL